MESVVTWKAWVRGTAFALLVPWAAANAEGWGSQVQPPEGPPPTQSSDEGGTSPAAEQPPTVDVLHSAENPGRVQVVVKGESLVEWPLVTALPGMVLDGEHPKALLAVPIDPNSALDSGKRLLMAALEEKDDALAQELLALGANPVYVPREVLEQVGARRDADELLGALALPREVMGALVVDTVTYGSVADLEEVLADEPAAVNWANDAGVTPLIQAATLAKVEHVAALLRLGANPNLSGEDGITPLAAAAMAADPAVLRELLDTTVLVDYAGPGGVRPLMAALAVGASDSARQLVDAGAATTNLSADRLWPGDFARAQGLEALQAEIGLSRTHPLHTLIAQEQYTNAVAQLKAGVSNPNERSEDGWPPLHLAAIRGARYLFGALLNARASIAALVPGDRNILHVIAYTRADGPFFLRLVREEADDAKWTSLLGQKDASGRTPLHAAIVNDHTQTARWLANHDEGVALSLPDAQGVTPLVASAIVGDASLAGRISEILAPGAITYPDRMPKPQDIARKNGDMKLLASLPYDFMPSIRLRRGITRNEARVVQRQLKAWGYYGGSLDGLIGPGTSTALEAFMRDRYAEIVEMAEAGTDFWIRYRGREEQGTSGVITYAQSYKSRALTGHRKRGWFALKVTEGSNAGAWLVAYADVAPTVDEFGAGIYLDYSTYSGPLVELSLLGTDDVTRNDRKFLLRRSEQ